MNPDEQFPTLETPLHILEEFLNNSSIWRDVSNMLRYQLESVRLLLDEGQGLDEDNRIRGEIRRIKAFIDLKDFMLELKSLQMEEAKEEEETRDV